MTVVETGGNEAIDRDQSVEDCPTLPTSVVWPAPVDQRLNEMLSILVKQGFDVSRSRLLAALVSTSSTDADDLETAFRRYLTLTAGEIVLQRDGAIVMWKRRPGRRPRS